MLYFLQLAGFDNTVLTDHVVHCRVSIGDSGPVWPHNLTVSHMNYLHCNLRIPLDH